MSYGSIGTNNSSTRNNMANDFGGFDSRGNGGGGNGYQGPTSLFGDFQGLCDTISQNIFKINTGATSLDRALKQIGTSKDSSQLRERIHDTEINTNRLTSDTARAFKQLSGLCSKTERQQKLQYERLMGEFQETVKRYHGLQKQVAEKVKTAAPLRSSTPSAASGNLISWGDGDESSESDRLLANERRREEMEAQSQVLENDLDLLREREEQIRQFEGDILDIRDIFGELAVLVHEQGEMIDNIEDNVETAAGQVEAGNEQLLQAARYQNKARKKMCILVVVLVIIAAILALVIYLSVRKH